MRPPLNELNGNLSRYQRKHYHMSTKIIPWTKTLSLEQKHYPLNKNIMIIPFEQHSNNGIISKKLKPYNLKKKIIIIPFEQDREYKLVTEAVAVADLTPFGNIQTTIALIRLNLNDRYDHIWLLSNLFGSLQSLHLYRPLIWDIIHYFNQCLQSWHYLRYL